MKQKTLIFFLAITIICVLPPAAQAQTGESRMKTLLVDREKEKQPKLSSEELGLGGEDTKISTRQAIDMIIKKYKEKEQDAAPQAADKSSGEIQDFETPDSGDAIPQIPKVPRPNRVSMPQRPQERQQAKTEAPSSGFGGIIRGYEENNKRRSMMHSRSFDIPSTETKSLEKDSATTAPP